MGVKIHTIKDIRFYLTKELENIYPDLEISALSNIIIKTVTGLSKLHQLNLPEQTLTREQAAKIVEICKELKTGKPVQYIFGETFFFNCLIRLNGSTLIPRPETEELVDLIIRENPGYKGNIIDFGTGSGCIAIALAANMEGAVVTGIDISKDALVIAEENAVLNRVDVSFLEADIFKFDYKLVENASIFVSNPPYVRNSERLLMSKNVIDFEPHDALFVSDSDPLVFYRAILEIAREILSPHGRIYFEINEVMGKPLGQLLGSFGYSEIRIIEDINGKERILRGIKDA